MLQNFDPRWVSFHYDTGHAVEAGANGTWALGCAPPDPISAACRSRILFSSSIWTRTEGGAFTGTPEQLNPRVAAALVPVVLAVRRWARVASGGAAAAGRCRQRRARAAAAGGVLRLACAGAAAGGGPGSVAGGRGAPRRRGGGGQPNPWRSYAVPLGTGMVDLPKIAQVLKDINFQGPVEIQAEYPNGGADAGQDKITLPRAMVLGAMKRDLLTLRAVLGPAGLI